MSDVKTCVFHKVENDYITTNQKMRQPGNKCSYKNCGKSRRSHFGLHMFAFPIKNMERCKQWVLNSGVEPSLLYMPDKLKNRRLCEEHFELSEFRNALRQKLNSTAVPKHYVHGSKDIVLPLEQVFVVCKSEPLEPISCDEEPLVVNRTNHTKTY